MDAVLQFDPIAEDQTKVVQKFTLIANEQTKVAQHSPSSRSDEMAVAVGFSPRERTQRLLRRVSDA